MNQMYTSAKTSINSSKLPAIYNKLNWTKLSMNGKFFYPELLDYGCGRYTDHIERETNSHGIVYYGYDKYNKTEAENELTKLNCDPDYIVCSNVLNVIAEDEIVQSITDEIRSYDAYYFITVYAGDGTGTGRPTQKGESYQRNQKTAEYLRFFPDATVCKGVITNAPDLLK